MDKGLCPPPGKGSSRSAWADLGSPKHFLPTEVAQTSHFSASAGYIGLVTIKQLAVQLKVYLSKYVVHARTYN